MSDSSYMRILKQLEELYPQASGEVLAAAARCETMLRSPPMQSGSLRDNVVDIRTHAATLRRARI